ncbi:hypothetical protein TWF694_007001 [Orbilia ellipsospora]|uniref:Cadmium resistance transporter n=1 Tax=Orbilia ellipsospora TaxID=2528407 RepID=A0AAV9XTK3_9PEZI
MQFGKAVGVACSSFAVTNIDNLFVLVTFFAEASVNNNKTLTPFKITLGQYIGFTIIIVISMIGYGASLVMPSEPIGFLGLLPILLGTYKFIQLVVPEKEPRTEEGGEGGDMEIGTEHTIMAWFKSIFKVSLVTVVNGGDNIGTYVPLFAQAKGAEIAVYIVIYYIMLALWCLSAFLVMKQKHILQVAQKYARVVIPVLYIGLGVYITIKSSCYPWSIRQINDSTGGDARDLGAIIMGVATTAVFLACIGVMLWLGLRKRVSDPPPDVGELDLRDLDAERDRNGSPDNIRAEIRSQGPGFKDLGSKPMYRRGGSGGLSPKPIVQHESGSSVNLFQLTPSRCIEHLDEAKG